MAEDPKVLTCEEKYELVDNCRKALRDEFGTVMAHIQAVLAGLTVGDSMSEIVAKLNVVCQYRPDDGDAKKLWNKAIKIFRGISGNQAASVENCVNITNLYMKWARGLLGDGQKPNGSMTRLCDNLTGDTFAEANNCGGGGEECIGGLSKWTIPGYCMKDVYKLSPNYQGVDDTTTGTFTVELTPTASSLISTGCDGDYYDGFGAMDGVDEVGNPLVPACRGTLEYLIQAAEATDGSEGKKYLEGKERYENIQEKINLIIKLIPKMIEAYQTMIEDFLKIIDAEVETAKTNSGKWLENLKNGLADYSKTIEKASNSTIQNVVWKAYKAGKQANPGRGVFIKPNLRTGFPGVDCATGLALFETNWDNQRAKANECVQKLMDTLHPTCKVQTSQYISAADLANKGANFDEFDDCSGVVTKECFAKAAAYIQGQPNIQCSNVRILGIETKRVFDNDSQQFKDFIVVTYEFSPVVVWDRGKIEAAGCNNGNIASYMGDMVNILNATRTPQCGRSPLEYLVVVSQDTGRDIKRIGSPGGTRPEAQCHYTWPNATDQNFGGAGNGPTNPECNKGASPTNCLQLPSIFSETELDVMGEFFLVMSIVLNGGGLMLKTEGDAAAAIWKRMRSSISNFANVRLNTANFEDCRKAGIQ